MGYFCADDTHGTATMIRAHQEGREPEDILDEMHAAHQSDLAAFGVEFDHYGSTHSETNRELCREIWTALEKQGLVSRRMVVELFDPETHESLPDRRAARE